MRNKKTFWASVIIGFIVFIALCIFLLSCEIIKHTKRNSNDSLGVKKSTLSLIDTGSSGGVKKDNSQSKETFDWWRVIQNYKPGDTTINNTYNNTYPATIVYEGGKGTREENKQSIDSTWIKNALSYFKNNYDSLAHKVETLQRDTSSETKGVGLITVLLICGGFVVAGKVLGFVGSKYTITKK